MAIREIKKQRSKKRTDYSKNVLVVSRSNKNISAQVLEAVTKRVLFSATSNNIKSGTKTEKSTKVGELIGKKLKEAGIEELVSDRNGYLYHGRVKAVFDAVRAEGVIL